MYIHSKDPEAVIPLCSDACITTFETTSRAKEPEQLAEAQTLKATGATSGELSLANYAFEFI